MDPAGRTRPAQEDTASPPRAGRRGPVVAALMLSMALVALDSTIVSTAVPQIVGDLGASCAAALALLALLLLAPRRFPVLKDPEPAQD